MALTSTLENDKIEIVQKWNIQVRSAKVIKEDGVEISRAFTRKVLTPGTLDASDNLVNTDLSGEDSDVRLIAQAAWSDQIKADYKAFLIANKSAS
tara:strand:- start:142 stop:426 length:285 start_codon:yes stop_codon:yes gene_type:complete